MLSGRRLDLLDPAPADIEIGDIAHGLARVARWNGQTTGPHAFSVAQHSLLVEMLLPQGHDDWRLAALLHDAPEYVVGDLISPFKAALGLDYKAFENRLLGAIHVRFGLPETLPADVGAAIKQADRIAAYWEATELAGQAAASRFKSEIEGAGGFTNYVTVLNAQARLKWNGVAPRFVMGGDKGAPNFLMPLPEDEPQAPRK